MASIKEIRESRGVKLCAVANHLGVSRQTYSRYEANQEKMTIEQMMAVCDFLHCDPDQIFLPDKVN